MNLKCLIFGHEWEKFHDYIKGRKGIWYIKICRRCNKEKVKATEHSREANK